MDEPEQPLTIQQDQDKVKEDLSRQDEEPSEDSDHDNEASWNDRFRASLQEVLRNHPLFGIFLAADDTKFTRIERIWDLMGFIAMQMLVLALFGESEMVDDAICACVSDKRGSTGHSCTSQGEELFSLPGHNGTSDYNTRPEWEEYVVYEYGTFDAYLDTCKADYVGGEESRCGVTKICCMAYINSVVSSHDVALNHDDSCNDFWDAIVVGVYGTIISVVFMSPLVQALLKRESKCLNPVAYLIIICQIAFGISFMADHSKTANDLGLSQNIWTEVAVNVSISLLLTSVVVGVLMDLIVTPYIVNPFLERCVYPKLKRCCPCFFRSQQPGEQQEDGDENSPNADGVSPNGEEAAVDIKP